MFGFDIFVLIIAVLAVLTLFAGVKDRFRRATTGRSSGSENIPAHCGRDSISSCRFFDRYRSQR